MRNVVSLTMFSALLGGCTTVSDLPDSRLASAELKYANGLPGGTVQVLGNGAGATLVIALVGAPEGPHGVHLHATGQCDAPDFKSAGGHLNPASRQHGSENPAGSHLGDLPNVVVGKSGSGTLRHDLAGDRAELLADLFDGDGTAVVVHAGPDDYRTDPSGNSGSRIACGVLKRL
jgi:Cu-Zn family superoxide dismutase